MSRPTDSGFASGDPGSRRGPRVPAGQPKDGGAGEEGEGVEQPLDPPELHLVRRESPEALGEHLPADHDVPPGGEDPPLDEDQGDEVEQLPELLALPESPEDLDGGEDAKGEEHPHEDLDDGQAEENLVHDQFPEDLDLLLALIDPVDEVYELREKSTITA